MTRRRWLIVVLCVLVLILCPEPERTRKRRSAFRQIMRDHAILAGAYRGQPIGCEFTREQVRVLDACVGKPNEPMAAYHQALFRKYRRAKDRPWEPVEPDPPEPK
jgi:hypothetical protein